MKNKRRKFLIATHGALAEGFRSSLDMIAGVTEDIYLLQAYIDKSKPVDEELADLFRGAGEEAGVAGEEAGVGGEEEEWVERQKKKEEDEFERKWKKEEWKKKKKIQQ